MLKNLFFFIMSVVISGLSNAEAVNLPTNNAGKALKSAVLEEDYQKLSHVLDSTLNGVIAAITVVEQSVDRQKLEGALANLNERLDITAIFSGINLGTPGLNEAKNNVKIL
ncbi:hypothetical protein IM40_06765 [Candidatus Paracaedimonas acanthamoebae]|nr:hypothetical protein IM40_06765 [Candidatus Paracaedimonas acanthamoebae]